MTLYTAGPLHNIAYYVIIFRYGYSDQNRRFENRRSTEVDVGLSIILIKMDGGVQGQQPVFSPAYKTWQMGRVWVVTFISYTCFHLARKVRDAPIALEMSLWICRSPSLCLSLRLPLCVFLSRCGTSLCLPVDPPHPIPTTCPVSLARRVPACRWRSCPPVDREPLSPLSISHRRFCHFLFWPLFRVPRR